MSAPPAPTPVFRWSGEYWGYLLGDELYDRHGRHSGWVVRPPQGAPEVYALDGAFLGELVDTHHVLRPLLRPEPPHRQARPPIPHRAPPDPLPARDARDARNGWEDVLAWPLWPPDPPAR